MFTADGRFIERVACFAYANNRYKTEKMVPNMECQSLLLMSLDPEREYIIEGAIGEGFKYERNPNV